jgi:hypothetical protein
VSGIDYPDCGPESDSCASITYAVAEKQPVAVMVAGGTFDETVSIEGMTTTIVGSPATVVTHTGSEAAFTAGREAVVEISHMTVADVLAVDGASILCNECTLVLRRSEVLRGGGFGVVGGSGSRVTVEDSIIESNSAGGVFLALHDTARVVNNLIIGNGNVSSAAGGVNVLGAGTNGLTTVAFNTIILNQSTNTNAAGIACTITQNDAFVGTSNIIHGNLGGPAVGGNCVHRFSSIENDPTGVLTNNDLVPVFNERRLDPSSTCCVDTGEPGIVGTDFEGDSRSPVAPDMGYDEL